MNSTAPATHTRHLAAAAAWLMDAHGYLAELRYKGTPRPWKQPDPTAQQRAEQDAEVRAERTDRRPGASSSPLPPAPAPIHLDVLDDLTAQHQAAHQAARRIAAALGDHTMLVQLARQADVPTPQLLHYIHAAAARLEGEQHAPTVEAATAALRRMKAATARHLTEVTEGQRLKTCCPWCGGEQLKIRTIGAEDRPEVVVRCESQLCEPPTSDCGTWHRGMPCWPFHEWEWLAKMIAWAND